MTAFGQPRRHVAQCTSTNDLARTWALDTNDLAPHGALVTADFQTQGRGQRGSSWQAGFGQSALMSFVVRPQKEISEAGQLAFVAALAVADWLDSLGLDSRLKWPNDILLKGRKVAGILVETIPLVSHPGAERQFAAIIGIGINVRQERFVGAEGFAFAPTSLALENTPAPDVEAVIAGVARFLEQGTTAYNCDGFPPILDACRKKLATEIVIRRGGQTAALTGLSDQGGALVRLANGTFEEWTTVEGYVPSNSV